MKTSDLTVVETRGSLLDRARQFGAAVRENHRQAAELFAPRRALLATRQGQRVQANVLRWMQTRDAALLDYLDAFADGVGSSRAQVIELNVLVSLCKSRLEACSGVIITRGGQTVVGQNWDTGASAASMAVLELGRSDTGPDTVRFASALSLDFWSGLNPYGLAMGGCSGPAGDRIGEGEGLTVTLWRGALFYQCASVADVKARVESIPMPGKGTNSVCVDAAGRMLWLQQGGGRFHTAQPEHPYCVATGYRPGLGTPVTLKERAERDRWRRLMALCAQTQPSTGDLVDLVKNMLADHEVVEGHPASAPCRHDGPQNSTQYAIITDLTNRVVYYCGQPCENEWQRVTLS